MNKSLLNKNKEFLNDEEKSKLIKQEIIAGFKFNNYDLNDQIALIINVLAENSHLLVESKHKDEFMAFLEVRKKIKEESKQ